MGKKEIKMKLAAAAGCLVLFVLLLIGKVTFDGRSRPETGEPETQPQKEMSAGLGALTLSELFRLLPECEESEEIREHNGDEIWLTGKGLKSVFQILAETSGESYETLSGLYPDGGDGTGQEFIYPEEFLDWYEAYLLKIPDSGRKKEVLFLLQEDDGKLVTNLGSFRYQGAYRYDMVSREKKRGGEVLTDIEAWLGQAVEAVTDKSTVVYFRGISEEEVTLENVWVISGKGKEFEVYLEGVEANFTSEAALGGEVTEEVADIRLRNGTVTGLTVKSDRINGKVLVSDRDGVEIEGYGTLEFDDQFKIYKIYGELGMEVTGSILVGYDSADFVVSGGKVCAALLTGPIKAETIRVLLGTNGFKGYYHESVSVTSDGAYTVSGPDGETACQAGEETVISKEMAEKGRIKVRSDAEEGKITVSSLKRSSGNPSYRGTIEITYQEAKKGFLLINELSLEEYLYAVIPSEMPVSYGIEALKAQAVCARSYAYNQLMANRFSAYGAHVDDSVSCQVYNNTPEQEESILAVKETYGKVAKADGSVISAYYFSTSCGVTTGAEDVWAGGKREEYLTGRMQYTGTAQTSAGTEKEEKTKRERKEAEALSDEEAFRKFLTDGEETYESGFAWYRWNTVLTKEQIEDSVNRYAKERYDVNPSCILTLVKEDGEERFESREPSEIGTIEKLEVVSRGTGGIVKELKITGKKQTMLIKTEYNVRKLLSPENSEIIKQDGSILKGMSMLPSAFLVIDPSEDKKEEGFRITGGGYGHGAGMSQNGAKSMAEEGNTFEEIIEHYYSGTTLGFIYD